MSHSLLETIERQSGVPRRTDESVVEYIDRLADVGDVDRARAENVTEMVRADLFAREYELSADDEATFEEFVAEIRDLGAEDDGAARRAEAPAARRSSRVVEESATPVSDDVDRESSWSTTFHRRLTAYGNGIGVGALARRLYAVFRVPAFRTPARLTRRDAVPLATLLLSGSYIYYVGLGAHRIITWDEGIYANAARNVVMHGYWLIPKQHWWRATIELSPFLEKPPGMMWLQALSMSVFGPTQFAARVPSATAAILCGLLAYCLGRDLYDRRTGLAAGVVWLTSPYVSWGFNGGRRGATDTTLVLLGTLFVFLVWKAMESENQRYLVYAGLAAGGAFFVKGFGIAPFVLVLLPSVVRNHSTIRDRSFALGATLALAIGGSWPLYAWLRRGDRLVTEFVVYQVFDRATRTQASPEALFPFMKHPYVTRFPMYFDPWGYFFLPAAIVVLYTARSNGRREFADSSFVLWWCLGILGFYAVTGDQGWYLLPMYLPAGIVVGRLFSLAVDGDGLAVVGALAGATGMALFSPRLGLTPVARSPYVRDLVPGCCNLGRPGAEVAVPAGGEVVLALGLALGLLLTHSRWRRWARQTLTRREYAVASHLFPVLFVALVVGSMAAPTPLATPERFEPGVTVNEQVPPDETLYVAREHFPVSEDFIAFDFYARRTYEATNVTVINEDERIRYAMLNGTQLPRLSRQYDVIVSFEPPHQNVTVSVVSIRPGPNATSVSSQGAAKRDRLRGSVITTF